MPDSATDFGNVLPGTSNLTSSDCEVQFGSSNDTSMLRVAQRDGGGEAMLPYAGSGTIQGHWSLNGRGTDLSANNVDMVRHAAADQPSYGAGPTDFGQALTFDNTDLASAASNAAWNITTFTVDLWFRTAGNSAVIATRANANCASGATCQWELYVMPDGRLAANLEVGAIEHSAVSVAVVDDNAWHHAAMTVDDATDTIKLYVDGSHVGTDTTWSGGSPDTGTADIWLGGITTGGYVGQVDEVRFQGGVRTNAEIAHYYSSRVDDYAATGTWAGGAGANLFGACLRQVTDGAATDGTTWPISPCTAADGTGLAPIVATTATAGAKVAIAPSGDIDAKARLRFGFKAGSAQGPGTYRADLEFEVVAPAV